MSIPLSKIPYRVFEALKGREYSDTQIEQMSAEVIFIQYCEWIGLCGFGLGLIETLDELRELQNEVKK